MKRIIISSSSVVVGPKSGRAKRVAFLAATLLSLGGLAKADTTESTWTGNTSSTWSVATNWTNGVPATAATPISAVFSGSFTNQPVLTASENPQGIWVTGSGNTGVAGLTTISGAQTLTITGNATLDNVANAGILLDGTGNNSLTISTNSTTLSNSTSFLVNNAGTLTVGAISNTHALTLGGSNASGSIVLSGVVSGTGGSIIDNSAGTVTLAGGNTLTGGVSLSSGTLNLNNTKSLGTGTFTISGGTIDNTTAGSLTQNSDAQTWNGSFAFGGTSALNMNNGAITLGASAITLTNKGASLLTEGGAVSGTANLAVNDNSTGGVTFSGAIGNVGTITNSGRGSGTTTFSGIIGTNVTGVVENSANSQLTLTAANTFTSGLTVDQGTVLLNNASSAGTGAITLGSSMGGSAGIIFAGNSTNAINLGTNALGTLTLSNIATNTAGITESGAIALNGDTLTLAGVGLGTFAQSGVISGNGTVDITGAAAINDVLLNGANTFTGAVNVLSGTVNLRVADALGNTNNVLTLSSGANLDTTASGISLANPLTILGNFGFDQLSTSGSLSVTGTLTLPTSSFTVNLGNASTGGGIAGRVLILGNTTLGGTTMTVQGNLTASGTTPTEVELGTVALTGNETFNVVNSANNASELALVGAITDTGSGSTITKNGSGILYLANDTENLTGSITVNGGTLGVAADAQSGINEGTGTIYLNDGTAFGRMDGGGSSGGPTNPLVIAANATVDLFNLDKSGFDYHGPISVGSGATLIETNPNGTTTDSFTDYTDAPVTLGGSLTLSAPQYDSGTVPDDNFAFEGVISNAASTTGDGIIISSTAVGNIVTISNASNTFDGGVTLNGGALALGNASTLSGGVVTKGAAGTGTLTLNAGSIGFTGNSVVSTSGSTYINNTLVIDGPVEFGGNGGTNGLNDDAMIFGGAVTIGNNAILTSATGSTANSISFNSPAIALSTVTLTSNIAIDPSAGSTFSFYDAIGDGGKNYGVTIGDGTSSGTVIFNTNTGNPNTYGGGTTVLSGTLQLAPNATAPSVNGTFGTTNSALTVNGGTVDLDSTSQSIGNLTGTGGTILNSASGTTSTLTIGTGNTGGGNYAGVIADNSGTGGTVALIKTGTGSITLSGANTYSGGTTISAGTLNITGIIGAVAVSNGGTLAGTGTTGAASLANGGKINLQDGAIGKLSVGGLSTAGGSGTFTFEIAANTAGSIDNIADSGTLSIGSGTSIDIVNLGGGTTGQTLASGSYTLITYGGTATGLGNLSLAYTTLDGDTLSLSTSPSGSIILNVMASATLANAYYNGTGGTDLATAAAYDTTATGNTAASSAPTSTTNIYFSNVANTNTTPYIDSTGVAANSVTFGDGSGTDRGISVAGPGTLTVEGGGIAIAANGGSDTISAPVALGAAQTWTSTSAASTLTVSGTVSGAYALTTAGAGAVVLTGSNTYSGGTMISAGTLYANNASGSAYSAPTTATRTITSSTSSSATGSGTVTVKSGGTLAGDGTITPGAGSGGVVVQSGGNLASGPVQSNASPYTAGKGLTLNNAAALSSILSTSGGSTLTFALGASSPTTPTLDYANPVTNSSYLTVAGNTSGEVSFATSGTTTINLVDLTTTSPTATLSLRNQNPYLLIQAGADSDYDLVTTGGYDANGWVEGTAASSGSTLDTSAFNLEVTSLTGEQINSATNYQHLQLYLFNGDLEVVPEPSTWAMMIGGLAVLIVIQRRKNKLA